MECGRGVDDWALVCEPRTVRRRNCAALAAGGRVADDDGYRAGDGLSTETAGVLSNTFWHGPMAFAVSAAHEFVRFVVADELFLCSIKFYRAAQTRHDVGKMRERGGKVARLGISDGGLRLIVPNRLEKIPMMQ